MAQEQRTRPAQLRQLAAADLHRQVAQARQTLWNARAKLRSGSLQKPHEIRATKRQIARLLTIVQEQAANTTQAKAT